MKLIKSSLVALSLTLLSLTPAWALNLNEAKAKGLVGETQTGYLAAVGNASAEVTALMGEINKKRRAAYLNSAKKAGVDLNIIEVRIGQRLYERAEKGAYLQKKDGSWYKK